MNRGAIISSSPDTTLLSNAAITWEANNLPRSRDFDDIYFSAGDSVAESHHVFIKGNQLEQRIVNLDDTPLVIAETGFGFGLNFLVSCEQFFRLAPEQANLHYLSCEMHPVLIKDMQRFYRQLPSSLQVYSTWLLENYPEQGKGIHRLSMQLDSRRLILDLLYEPALNAFNSASLPDQYIDAWYLDGHAPSQNTTMWDLALCKTFSALSKPGSTTFATYTVAGAVRRNLQEAGFSTEKIAGYGKKRHMLAGKLKLSEQREKVLVTSWKSPWPKEPRKIKTIAIIGAGLAGCATAHALAKRGYKVSLIEKNDKIASGASGNPRAIVHVNPGRQLTPANLFRLNAFHYARAHYSYLAKSAEFGWNTCGLIQLATNEQELEAQKDLLERKLYDPALLQFITAKQGAQIANIQIDYPGLWFPGAGCLAPANLCQAWINSKNISLMTSHEVIDYEYRNQQWLVSMAVNEGNKTQAFDALVICNNHDAARFSETARYPLICNHGQTDTYSTADSKAGISMLKTIVRHQGYIIPWQDNGIAQLTIGGSFAQGEHESAQSLNLKKKNLQLAGKISPSLHSQLGDIAARKEAGMYSRAGTRVSTPDYLPLCGPVENMFETEVIFEGFKRNAKKDISANAEYHPGLFVNIGHGSSGLTFTPVLAEYLACLISGEGLPLNREETSAILPLRYLIRNLKRQVD